ncbi:AAA family ATPase [Arthrobacter sp. UYEF20]|uniref:ATP-dependent DNA helicase n=1 Tax=Arthrobacter sp. UYEF20 TaxID=1756363 RepID=UPI00339909C4
MAPLSQGEPDILPSVAGELLRADVVVVHARSIEEAAHGPDQGGRAAKVVDRSEVLGRELAMVTENVAKWLYESVGQGAGNRATRFFDAERQLSSQTAGTGPLGTRLTQKTARLAADQDKWRFHPNQLVIVDEASMVSTLQLSALVQQARDAVAEVLLVGDPGQLDAIDAGGVLGWLDRQGKTVRLSTIWRFEQAWEQEASLKLRAGDFAAIDGYERYRRIQHGSCLDMVDHAYQSWQSHIRDGKSSILIAADNDTVNMLNQRAQADRVIQGSVDAEHTVPLSDGSRAGIGDTVIARRNDRHITDSSGDFIRNGTMLDVVRTGRGDGSLTAVRRDTGATVMLNRDYVEASVELGYATTAHRSQGITVDTGHTVVTQGRLTRELLYVSMTRGRAGNYAYVSENDPMDDEPLDPALQASWRQILGEVLAAEGAERTAHEVRDAEQSKADSLEQRSTEYDYLAQIAAAEDLATFLDSNAPGRTPELQESPAWGAAVAAWRRSLEVSRPSTQRLVLGALETNAGARDMATAIHARLRHFVSRMPAGGVDSMAEPIRTARPDLDDMINQVRDRLLQRMDHVTEAAMMQDTEWKRNLLDALGPATRPEDATSLIRRVAIYRDRWGIDDSTLPLGPLPASYEWNTWSSEQSSTNSLIKPLSRPTASGKLQSGSTVRLLGKTALSMSAGNSKLVE